MSVLFGGCTETGRYRKKLEFFCCVCFLVLMLFLLLAAPPGALAKASSQKPQKQTKWILEFEQVATGKWGGEGKVWGEVEFLVSRGGGPVDTKGGMWLLGTNAKGEGTMVIEGNVNKKRLTFVPDQKYFTVTAYGQTTSAEIFDGTEKIRMPFRDGAKLVERFSDAGGTTETTWKLQGIEEWRVTVDSRQISFPERPELNLPSKHWAGLRNQWRLVVNFEVTRDSYLDGRGKFSLVKWDSYSEPAGLYKAVHLRHRILDDLTGKGEMAAVNVGGEKSGQWVTLFLPDRNRIDFLYRLEKKKEATSYRVEGEPVHLPSDLTFRLREGRREYKLFEGPLSENLPKEKLVRGKPETTFWKYIPWGAHVVITVKRIR